MNLNQVTIPVKNVEASILFYQKLGLKLIVHSHAHYARFECPDGNSTLSLHTSTNISNGDGIVLYFETDKLDENVSNLKSKGIVFETEPIDQNWLWREASLRDLDGHKIILFYAGENRKNPPWKLKTESN